MTRLKMTFGAGMYQKAGIDCNFCTFSARGIQLAYLCAPANCFQLVLVQR